MLTPRQARQVRAAVAEIERRHAMEIAEYQLDQATDHRIHMIQLEGQHERTEIRDQFNEVSGDLARRQAELTSSAILAQVESNSRVSDSIMASQCTDEDKSELMTLAHELAMQQMQRIALEGQRSE